MCADELPNLAELYPAAIKSYYWLDRNHLYPWEAILLSLDINPLDIDELRGLNLGTSDEEEEEPLHFGLQQVDYDARLEELLHAISHGRLERHETQDERQLISRTSFISWAQARGWRMPFWLTYQQQSSANGQRIGLTLRSVQINERLEAEAKVILAESCRPHTRSSISGLISRRLSHDIDFMEPSTIRNRLFNEPHSPFKGSKWDEAKREAGRVRALRSRQTRG